MKCAMIKKEIALFAPIARRKVEDEKRVNIVCDTCPDKPRKNAPWGLFFKIS